MDVPVLGEILTAHGMALAVISAGTPGGRSLRMACSWRHSKSVTLIGRQRSGARIMAPNMSLRTGFSPNAFKMILAAPFLQSG